MAPGLITGRVVHGGTSAFRAFASYIDAAVEDGDVAIWTRGAAGLSPPAHYWFYNTEPLHLTRKRTPEYLRLLDGADRVFDYSEPNLQFYSRAEFCPIHLGVVGAPPDLAACDIDVLFYGHPTPRRRAVVEALQATVIHGVYGAALTAQIRRAKIVLSLNAYDDVNGNPFRVFPVLEAGGHIVAEWCQEEWFNKVVEQHGLVVPYEDMVSICQALLKEVDGA